MATIRVDPFDCQMPFPLDLRYRRADLNGRNNIPVNARFGGMPCWVASESVLYILGESLDNEDWFQVYPVINPSLQNVTFSPSIPANSAGNDGDIWFREDGDDIQLYYKVGGTWGMLGSWGSGAGGASFTPDPSLPDPPTLSYLNTNYPTAKPGDIVYWEGTTQVVEAKCYAAGEWNWITKNRAQ